VTAFEDVISDLNAEGDAVDRLVDGLDEAGWALPTPAPGWTIAHQVAHLTATFRLAGLAAADPAAFGALASQLSSDFDANVRGAMAPYLSDPVEVLFKRWQAERASATNAIAAVPPAQLVPWLVRPLPPAVLASAGMMELFGHGQDIHDALGIHREPTDRLRTLVTFAVRTWDFGYQARGLATPDTEFRFEITGPAGDVWTYGPEDATNRVTGPAMDFCLLVTRRRHPADLAVTGHGADAAAWVDIAQAYRGPSGAGRTAGQFSS
jgi:uncharacterized protein (TIGR03084 family)